MCGWMENFAMYLKVVRDWGLVGVWLGVSKWLQGGWRVVGWLGIGWWFVGG